MGRCAFRHSHPRGAGRGLGLANVEIDPREVILQECAAAAPQPWYPRRYAETQGIDRNRLDAPLDDLRLHGLIELTEWVEGRGQGYRLTPHGHHFLQTPFEMARIRSGRPLQRGSDTSAPERNGPPATTTWDRGEAVREALLGTSTPVVTLLLLFANLLIFAYGMLLASRHNLDMPGWMSVHVRPFCITCRICAGTSASRSVGSIRAARYAVSAGPNSSTAAASR